MSTTTLTARAGTVAALLLALCGIACDTASATWERISPVASTTGPYFACPGSSRAARCDLVQDPTRGSRRLGQLPLGAITRGPDAETSPAMLGTGVEGGYSPADLQSAYRLPSASAGAGETVAIVDAFDDPNAEADLAVYRAQYELGECTSGNGCFRKVNQTGGGTMPEPNRTWAKEISLDLDMVSAICPDCHILLVEANNGQGSSLAAAENEAVALHATEISDSYEEAEPPEQPGAYDHPGVPIAVAGGDHGYGTVAPASSPHVIAVGGTTLVPVEGRRRWAETVWHTSGGGTGSGCSHEPKPAWQSDPGCSGRTANDLAAVADPNTPVSAYDSYESSSSWMLLGGTSASAPIVAAAMALSTPYTRSFDGAQPLYLDVEDGGGFNDVVSGSNGTCGTFTYLCEAGPGYDGPSGLGTLRGAPEVPPPAAVTGTAGPVAQTTATLAGSVNPHGATLSECGFQYGPTAAYGAYAPCVSLPPMGTSPVGVSAVLAGLLPGAAYHSRLVVSYPGGSSDGADVVFRTPGVAPTVFPGEPSNATWSSVNLNALVDPNGSPVSACAFEYGPTALYGSLAPCSASPGEGRAPVPVSASLGGLVAIGTYHFRIVATNAIGTAYGGDQTVTLPASTPSATTLPPTAVGSGTATLNATVNANGSALTRCAFEFNSAETLIPCTATPGPLAGASPVSATAARLRPGATYRYRIVAANAAGRVYGALEEFVAAPSSSQVARHAASLASTRLLATARGSVRVNVRCPSHRSRCRGTITLRTSPEAVQGGATRVVASGAFAVASGRTLTISLRLTGLALAMLSRHQLVNVGVTVRTTGSAGAWHTHATLSRFA